MRRGVYRGAGRCAKSGVAQDFATGDGGGKRTRRSLHRVEAARSGKIFEVNLVVLREKRRCEKTNYCNAEQGVDAHRVLLDDVILGGYADFDSIIAQDNTPDPAPRSIPMLDGFLAPRLAQYLAG